MTTVVIHDLSDFFAGTDCGAESLLEFLSALGEQKGWDVTQTQLHLRYALHTRSHDGQVAVIKYLESLL